LTAGGAVPEPPLPLRLAHLDRLPAGVGRPDYRREGVTPGIVHFGVGNFHRAHMASYLDALMAEGRDRDWAVIGAGVMPGDERMRAALAGQDWLSTVVTQTASRSEARVIGALVDFLPVAEARAIVAALADPAIRIVSMTVTEGGYFVDPATGAFARDHPAIQADAAAPDSPKTVFGLILAGLRARRAAGLRPFTVLSCDNLPGNGDVARQAVAGLAGMIDPALGRWVHEEVAFPNGMVDRIAIATGDRERRLVKEMFGIDDAAPVFCETFCQWVVEDRFPAGRPALDEVGVTFTDDVAPFERLKLRVLNAGHAILAYPAALLDIEHVHEAMAYPLVRGFLEKVERQEVLPVLPPVPGIDPERYLATCLERFANPSIADTIRRLCHDGANRQPKFILPTLADRLTQGLGVDGLALESALWCRYCAGTTEGGGAIAANAPDWDRLNAAALAARHDPAAWLGLRDIYGRLGDAPAFRDAFAEALQSLWRDGTEAVLQRYLDR